MRPVKEEENCGSGTKRLSASPVQGEGFLMTNNQRGMGLVQVSRIVAGFLAIVTAAWHMNSASAVNILIGN